MGTSEYQELAKKRAGIEGIPSALRRRYNIDHLPIRGEVRVRAWLGFKISAINCKRLIKGLINRQKKAFLLFYIIIYYRYLVFKGQTELDLLLKLNMFY